MNSDPADEAREEAEIARLRAQIESHREGDDPDAMDAADGAREQFERRVEELRRRRTHRKGRPR